MKFDSMKTFQTLSKKKYEYLMKKKRGKGSNLALKRNILRIFP